MAGPALVGLHFAVRALSGWAGNKGSKVMIEAVKNVGYFATVTAITEKNAVCDYWQSGMQEAEEWHTEEAEAERLSRLQPALIARCNDYDGRHIPA